MDWLACHLLLLLCFLVSKTLVRVGFCCCFTLHAALLYHVIELTLSGVLAHSSAWQGGECNMFKTVLFCFQPVTDSLQSLFVVVVKSIYTHILGKMLFFCLFHVYSLMFFICCSWILFSITCHFVFFYSFSFVSWNQEDSLLMGCSAF